MSEFQLLNEQCIRDETLGLLQVGAAKVDQT
jgi:hypothetical protein